MNGFKYDKFKSEIASGDSWGSYSDLFMVLSFIFLMMYVVASLRSGTSRIQQRIEQQKVARENDDLKAQIKAYNALKDSALQDESQDEQAVYTELMDKLALLQGEAKEEKNRLRREAVENEKKEMALNKYQQIIRNIINANLLAKNKLKVREEIIANKNEVIVDLNQDIESKKKEISKNNQQIAKITSELNKNIEDLQKAQRNQKITRQKAYAQIALLKKKSQAKIDELNKENKMVQSDLARISKDLAETNNQLEKSTTVNKELTEKLDTTVGQYEEQIKNLQNAHAQKMVAERSAFEQKLKKANLTAEQKANQLEAFNRLARAKNEAMDKQIAGLKGELADVEAREAAKNRENQKLAQDLAATSQKLEKTVGDYEGQIKALQDGHAKKAAAEKAEFDKKLKAANMSAAQKAEQLAKFNQEAADKAAAMNKQLAGLKGELAEAEARANARAQLANEIQKALRSAGVEANVNAQTGDVTIAFGRDYFDSGSAELKNSMAEVLKRFVPRYSESLFKDPKIANKITSVDIIGFASPTYKNKYVDPQSLNPDDQKAAKYNLDLSYKRARAIFDYMFDTRKIHYKNQRQLLSLVKVTGRSFFAEGRTPSGAIPGMDQKEFCKKFDCKQAQKVIIKFNMDDKK